MNIGIVGCGAMGSIYGAHLALQPDTSIWVYDPDPELVNELNTSGIRLQGVRNLHASVVATSDPANLPPCEFGIIATKSFHTQRAIGAVRTIFEGGVLCSIQNGIGNEEVLATEVARVLSGSTLLGGHIIEPGLVDFDIDGPTLIGPAEAGSATLQEAREFAEILSAAGLETEAVSDPRGVKWAKLIFNASANMVCALSRLPFYTMYQQPGLRDLANGLALEGVCVAQALGIDLAFNPVEKLESVYAQKLNHEPSTLTDIRHGRRTEVDVLNGAIVDRAQDVGISCPLNTAVTALIRGLETSALVSRDGGV